MSYKKQGILKIDNIDIGKLEIKNPTMVVKNVILEVEITGEDGKKHSRLFNTDKVDTKKALKSIDEFKDITEL